jgi:hypothetical protein
MFIRFFFLVLNLAYWKYVVCTLLCLVSVIQPYFLRSVSMGACGIGCLFSLICGTSSEHTQSYYLAKEVWVAHNRVHWFGPVALFHVSHPSSRTSGLAWAHSFHESVSGNMQTQSILHCVISVSQKLSLGQKYGVKVQGWRFWMFLVLFLYVLVWYLVYFDFP